MEMNVQAIIMYLFLCFAFTVYPFTMHCATWRPWRASHTRFWIKFGIKAYVLSAFSFICHQLRAEKKCLLSLFIESSSQREETNFAIKTDQKRVLVFLNIQKRWQERTTRVIELVKSSYDRLLCSANCESRTGLSISPLQRYHSFG